jgi:hypothetical protein
MRKSVVVIAISAALIAWPAVDVATMGTGRADERAVTPGSRVKRETRYYGIGPSARYDFDAGSIGEVRPLRVPFASGSPVDVVITISMDYRTSADDGFVVAPLVRRNGRFGAVVRTRPRGRVVAASTTWTSSTTAFLIGGLRGGHEYWFSPTVNVSDRVGNRASITSRHVVFVVDATPS